MNIQTAIIMDNEFAFYGYAIRAFLVDTGCFNEVLLCNLKAILPCINEHPDASKTFIVQNEKEKFQTEDLVKSIRNANASIVIVIMLLNDDISGEHMKRYRSYGVNAILSRNVEFNDFQHCLTAITSESFFLCHKLQTRLLQDLFNPEKRLTKRQQEVLTADQEGYSIEETARLLGLSKHTVAEHRRRLLKKYNVHSMSAVINCIRKENS